MRVCTTSGPDFGANFHCKNLQTSAARFHEFLSDLILKLEFKNTKHDPDLWMVDKSSFHECLATYVDDILIRS
jgi:hypothetical protein